MCSARRAEHDESHDPADAPPASSEDGRRPPDIGGRLPKKRRPIGCGLSSRDRSCTTRERATKTSIAPSAEGWLPLLCSTSSCSRASPSSTSRPLRRRAALDEKLSPTALARARVSRCARRRSGVHRADLEAARAAHSKGPPPTPSIANAVVQLVQVVSGSMARIASVEADADRRRDPGAPAERDEPRPGRVDRRELRPLGRLARADRLRAPPAVARRVVAPARARCRARYRGRRRVRRSGRATRKRRRTFRRTRSPR